MFDVYKPSGRFGVSFFPLLICGIVAAIIAAFVYQLLLRWIPFIYVSFLLTLAGGFVIGFIVAFLVNTGHVRNVMLAALAAVALSVCFLGAKFYCQYYSAIAPEIAQLAAQVPDQGGEEIELDQTAMLINAMTSPKMFLQYIQLRAENGWQLGRAGRGGGGGNFSGIFVYLIWLIEAGIVFFFAVPMAMGAAREPYSEELGRWANEEETVMTLPVTDSEMVAQIQSASSVDQLLTIPIPQTDQSNQFAVYNVNSIPGQEMENAYLSVNLLTLSVNSEGETQKQEQPLVRHAILSSQQREQLVENAELLKEAMNEYRQAVHDDAIAAMDEEQIDDDIDVG